MSCPIPFELTPFDYLWPAKIFESPYMKFSSWSVALLVALTAFFALTALAMAQNVYFGTGGNNAGQPAGIYKSQFDEQAATLSPSKLLLELQDAGWVTKHPTLEVIYATAKSNNGPAVVSVDIGSAEAKQTAVQGTGGGQSCFITTDRTGKLLISTQYSGSAVSVFPIAEDGALQPRSQLIKHGPPSRVHKNQKSAHPHYCGISPDNRFAFVCDLGMDKIVVYKIDHDRARLEEVSKASAIAGGGPRHMKFHPQGKFALVLNELTLSVSVFRYDVDSGALTMVGTTQALTSAEKALNTFNSASEIRIHPNGKFVYSGNRGHDSITSFKFDSASGELQRNDVMPIRGAWPRNFNLSPSGEFLLAAGKDTNSVTVFKVDQETGKLQYQQHSSQFVPGPICVMFDQAK